MKSEKEKITILNNMPELVVYQDTKNRILWANRAAAKSVNLTLAQLANNHCYKIWHQRDKVCIGCPVVLARETGKSQEAEIISPDGKIWYIQGFPMRDKDNKIEGILEVAADITERKLSEKVLLESKERFQQVAENAQEWIWEIDTNGLYTYVSPAVKKLLGYRSEKIIYKKYFYDFFHPKDRKKLKEEAFEVINKKLAFREFENRNVRKDGKAIWLLTSGAPMLDKKGNLVGYRGANIDITKRKLTQKKLQESNKKLKQLVLRDPQTGLYNHYYLKESIESEFHRARRYNHPLSVMMMDVDYFKSINDTYGHQFGDLVLKQLAEQLKRMVRQYDIVIRFGGEEFVIISPGTDKLSILNLTERILNAVNLYNFGDTKHSIKLGLSIAVASWPDDKIFKGMDFINIADKILSKVKESGGNKVYSSLDIGEKPHKSRKEANNVRFLKLKIDKLTRQSNQNLKEAVFAFARTIKLKDNYTGEHVENTVSYATEIAKTLGLHKDEIEQIKQASMLHDLGKLGISEKIILKSSKLTRREFSQIKKHPQIGVDIIRPLHFFHDIIPLILYHHERFDGKGYLCGLKGEEIPIGARIIAIADVYQALVSDRPYRKAYPKDKAVEIIKDGSGTQFDPKVVNLFIKILEGK